MTAIQRQKHRHVEVYGAPKSYLYYPLLRARPRLLSVLCMSPIVSPSSPADSHNWSAAPRGATFTKTRVQKPSAVTDESLSLSSFPFLSLCFPLQKISESSLVFCSTLAALLFFFHYLVRFSSSLCLPLHRSHHQLFLLLLLLLLPFAHIDSLLSVRHGLKNLTDVR